MGAGHQCSLFIQLTAKLTRPMEYSRIAVKYSALLSLILRFALNKIDKRRVNYKHKLSTIEVNYHPFKWW